MQLREALWPSDGNTDSVIHAESSECGMSSFDIGTADHCASVIAAWNRRASLEAPLREPQQVPPGWKLVPMEPTEEMWTAGRDPIMYRDVGYKVLACMEAPPWRINPATGQVEKDQSKGTTAVHVWRAMLAASPEAAVPMQAKETP